MFLQIKMQMHLKSSLWLSSQLAVFSLTLPACYLDISKLREIKYGRGHKVKFKKTKASLGFYKLTQPSPGESWISCIHVLKPIGFLLFLQQKYLFSQVYSFSRMSSLGIQILIYIILITTHFPKLSCILLLIVRFPFLTLC